MRSFTLFLAVLVLVTAPALADWQPGDGHKMHFPQLPDEAGWDVRSNGLLMMIGDDWQCSQSGYVTDIHFWGSWLGGIEGQIIGFTIQIYDNFPGPPYSQPQTVLWEQFFENFAAVPIDPPTMEGWYDPFIAEFLANDHQAYFQYNITGIPNPFYQQAGQIYWLVIGANVANGQWGWKNSQDHFMDDAVFGQAMGPWMELYEPPDFQQSMDMAFVITGKKIPTLSEWGLIALVLLILAAGTLIVLRRRRATA